MFFNFCVKCSVFFLLIDLNKNLAKPPATASTTATTTTVITTAASRSVCQRQLSIILVIDASSNSKDLWVNLKLFLINFINEFNVGQVSFAAVKYASFATTEFEFLLEKQAVLDAIGNSTNLQKLFACSNNY